MAADALVTCVTRPSATMVLVKQEEGVHVYHEEGFELTIWALIQYKDVILPV